MYERGMTGCLLNAVGILKILFILCVLTKLLHYYMSCVA